MPEAIDQLIHARWVIPVSDNDPILEQHSLAIHHGRIVDLLPTDQASGRYEAEQVTRLDEQVLIPGLINAHTHAAMSLLRGLADDLPLMSWLNDHIWPAEGRWISEEFIADGSRLAIAEMIRSGSTCFNDMYFFPDVTAQVAASAGMRAVVGLIVIDFPSAWAADQNEYFSKAVAVADEYRPHPLIHCAFAPHAPYSVSDGPLSRVRKLADELQIPIHIHVHETADEVAQGIEAHGQRPIARLDQLGLLSPELVGVHMTQLQDDEIERLAATGSHVVHCPESNLKLASGFCPVARLLEAGINVALGTDGAASNNDLDMLGEMRSAALLGKGVAGDARALPAMQVLRMATINGARALGIEAETGSLEVGKSADVCAVRLDALATTPIYNPLSQLVYASSRDQVSDVWIAGKRVLRDGQLTTLDVAQIRQRAAEWQQRIAEQV